MGDESKIKGFYYGTLNGEVHRMGYVENIPLEEPDTVETDTMGYITGDLGEVELSFNLDKQTAFKLRWMFFKEHIKTAFSILFGKGKK